MKKNKARRKIYIRTFAALMAAYLVLMVGFSIFMINQQKKVEGMQFCTTATNINDAVEAMLRDEVDDNNQIIDIDKFKNECMTYIIAYNRRGIETAIFTSDFNLLLNTNNTNENWICLYLENGDINKRRYAYLDPKKYFTGKEIREINRYRNAVLQSRKKSDPYLYAIYISGFWLDNERIIPNRIMVDPVYVEGVDKKGNVTGTVYGRNVITYNSNYTNSEDLPYYDAGCTILSVRMSEYEGLENQRELINMVTDKDKLQKAVSQDKYQEQYLLTERVDPVTYRYYAALPNQDDIGWATVVNNEAILTNYGAFWTVSGVQVNLLKKCIGTLIFVWTGCFALFTSAAFFLSVQSYKIYRKREELDRYRGETTNALAHDLKTPLSIISGYAQNLMENVHTEKREYYAGNINENVNRMDKIIREMLELSRYDTNTDKLIYEDVSLGEACTKLISRYRQLCDDRRITAALEGDAVVKADFALMERVIDNFFVNALDFTPEGGIIQITIADNTLEFFNSGSHIPEDIINEIWQPYKKADVSRSNAKGTGLGLSISGKILDLYKFSYGVKNTDEGVVFWFKW